MNNLVSIIIVNYNGKAFLENCLRSVYAQAYSPIEVIVVDNASKDGSVDLVRNSFPDVHLVLCENNLGFAEGNNRGVGVAQGGYVVLLNNDTEVDDQWLCALIEMMKHPAIGVVTSKVITDGVPLQYYEMNGSVNYLGYNIMRVFSDLSEIFFAGGASLMFRKEDVGSPFLNEYFLYQEDVYLSWKMRLQGRSAAMAQASIVSHRGSVTTKKHTSAFVTFYQERNRMLNCLLMYQARTLILLLPYFGIDALVKIALSIVVGRKSFWGILKSYWWLMTHVGWINVERRRLQNSRKVRDSEIMRLMCAEVVNGDSRAANLVNGMSRLYARTVGLSYHG